MKTRALLLIFFWAALPATGQQPAPAPPVEEKKAPLTAQPSRDLFDLATLHYNSALKEKDPEKRELSYRSAYRTFDKFLRAYPKDSKAVEAWYFLGLSYRQVGEDKASRTCFERVATTWTTGKFVEASALFLAKDDYAAEKWRDAAKWFRIVATTTQDRQVKHEALYRRFLSYRKLESKPNMLLSLKAVLAYPGSPYAESARLALARLYQNSQSHRQAHEQYVILADSKKAEVRSEAVLQAALTAQKLGSKTLTKRWFRKALDERHLKEVRGQTQLTLMSLHYNDKEWTSVIEAFKAGDFKLEKTESLQRLIMAAKSYEALGKKKEVAQLYDRISKLSPGSATSYQAAYRVLVRDHERKDRNFARSAESFLKSYAAKNPKDPKIHSVRLLLAEKYYAAKDYQKAIGHYRLLDLTLIDPANERGVRYHVARSQLALKNEEGAIAAIGNFIAKFPDSKQALQLRLDRAEILTANGRETEALKDYQAVLDETGDQSLQRIILLRLAAAHQEKKEWPEFAALQKKILKLPKLDKKTEASANFWLGWNELRLKKGDTAIPYLRQARTLDPNTFTAKVGPMLVRSAYKAEDTKLLEEEINLLRRSSSDTKLPSGILRWLGATLSKKGLHTRAWSFLNEGMQDQSAEIPVLIWKLYTQSALATKHFKEAITGADAILAAEKNAYRKAEALYFKSQAFTELRKYNDARQATSDALDLRPQGELDLQLRTFAGDIDTAQDRPEAAFKHYVIVNEIYAKTPEDKKKIRAKIISTLKAIATPEALRKLKDYQN